MVGRNNELTEQDAAVRRAALESVLAGAAFSRSPRMSRFLRHVVEAALAGDDGALKETAIGVSVFDRSPGYDPSVDSIVRNEARRLRVTLDRHYAEEGRDETVRISIPKGGYRPVFDIRAAAAAEATPPAALGAPAARQASAQRASARRAFLMVAVASALVFALVTVATVAHLTSAAEPPAAPLVRALTADPEREVNPSFSPDGRQLAYAWDRDGNYDIFIKSTESDAVPFQLTTNAAQDIRPAWSPDGRSLAFLRTSDARRLEVVIVPASGGRERVVSQVENFSVTDAYYEATPYHLLQSLGPGPAWTPDGSSVVVTGSRRGDGSLPLQLVAPSHEREPSQRRTLTDPPPGARDVFPAFSRDGSWMAFGRLRGHSTYELHVMAASGGETRRIAFGGGDIQGIAWAPDGRSLVVSSSIDGTTYQLWRADVESGRTEPLPTPGRSLREPTISPDGARIVCADVSLTSALWRVRTAVDGRASGAPERLLASTAVDWAAAYSPDGSKLAFISTRSGFQEVWTSDADGRRQQQVTHFEGAQVGWPRWSPDGRFLAFDAHVGWRANIYMVSSEGGTVKQLPMGATEELRPSWSNDGRWLFFYSNRNGVSGLWRRPFTHEGEATLLTSDGETDSVGLPGSSTLYFAGLHDVGIWQVEPGSKGAPVPGLEKVWHGRMWALNKTGIWFVDRHVDSRTVWLYRFSTGRIERAANLDDDVPLVSPRLSVSPDGEWITYSRYSVAQGDLWTVDYRTLTEPAGRNVRRAIVGRVF